MRRLLVIASALAGFVAACASDDATRFESPLYPVYDVHHNQRVRGRGHTRASFAPSGHMSSWYPRGRRISPRWTYIVLHHSATDTGGASRFDKYHRQNNGWDELGYHFVIGNGTDTPDGSVEVGPRWYKQKHGAHCKTPGNYYNEHGIGICLVGDFTVTRPTPRQLASLEHLVRFLCEECGIPTDRVTTHDAIKRTTRCPGRYFEVQALRRALTSPPTASIMP